VLEPGKKTIKGMISFMKNNQFVLKSAPVAVEKIF
jgi:hypothetical protein